MTQPQRIAFVAFGALGAAFAAGWWALQAVPDFGPATGLPDAGDLTRWGLPASRVIRDLAMATTIGALLTLTFLLPRSPQPQDAPATAVRTVSRVAICSATVWILAGLMVLAFSYSELAGVPASRLSGAELRYFLTDFPLGKAIGWNLALAVVAGVVLVLGRTPRLNLAALAFALVALWPLATTGHAAGALNHDYAVNSQALHLLGISIWLGTLAAIALTWHHLDEARIAVVERFSLLAGWAFVLVSLSGLLAAVLRVQTVSGLSSTYGTLILLKTAFLVVLACAGYMQRTRFIGRLRNGESRGFARLVMFELFVMAAAVAAGVALGGTPPPRSSEPRLTTAESLLGYSLPKALDATGWLTSWRLDSLWVPMAALAIGLYLTGAVRLRRRGDRWPLGRSLAWISGWAAVIWATSGPPGIYGDVLFSVHMIQHMTIATTAPILMVLGAPVTLALRTLPRRQDASIGLREWLLILVQARLTALLAHPIVAAGMFVGGMVVFYYSSLFEVTLRSHTAHNLMVLHFMLTGYLFASVIIGIDPGIRRPEYPLRILLVLVAFGFHALFAVSLMNANRVLAADWFNALARPWGATPLEDQRTGASIGWLLGDYPLALIAAALIWGWVRDDSREAKRLDRQADRDGNKTLNDYNAYLKALRVSGHPPPAGTDAEPGDEGRDHGSAT